jgi:hypothetical protein
MLEKDTKIPEFSLFGGPLWRLGVRLGLVRGGTDTFRLGLALGLPAWSVLIVLALLQGLGSKIFSLAVIGVHVRLLVAIPLFFACESFVGPRMSEFVRNILGSELVPEDQLPALASNIRRVRRLTDSWLAEALFLLLALTLPLLETFVDLPGRTGNWTAILAQAGGKLTLLNGWYLIFCLPLIRFLILRWVWRLGLWWHFLWRLRKLNLHLIPTHSDGAGGLGFLEVVQEHFTPLALAISAVLSASFAEGIFLGNMAFEALYHLLPAVLVLVAALFIGPLFLFTRKLWYCRSTGLDEYMAMASRYVHAFDHKWIRDESASGESQLGTADMQSLADLTNSMNVVRNMRLVPGGRRLVIELAACVILPMLPLLLLKFPVSEIAVRLFRALSGL